MAVVPVRRVLVHLQKQTDLKSAQRDPAEFTQSILDYFGSSTSNHVMDIYADVKEDRLTISDKSLGDHRPIKIKRPSFCPIHNLVQDQIDQLSADTRNRGIDVGAATVLETSDGKILLTRRADTMRIFPGIWVPPGGHLEVGETVLEGGLRELKEETGLDISPSDCDQSVIPILAMWESVYPPKLSVGLPSRHHAVLYMYAKLKPPLTQAVLQQQLNPDPKEVGACAWIDRPLVEAVVAASEEGTIAISTPNLPASFRATLVDKDGGLSDADLSTSILTSTATGEQCDRERVSTGTKFCLKEWLRLVHPDSKV